MTDQHPLGGQATTVTHFLAKKILSSSTSKARSNVGQSELAESIGEVELQTQIKGASFIKAHLYDPEWALQVSGLIDVSAEGLLHPVEVEFPEKSSWLWILVAVEGTTELNRPNLILTFEDKIIFELRGMFGKKTSTPGFNTRAEFIKLLVNEVKLHGKPTIRFVSPTVEGKGDLEAKRSASRLKAAEAKGQTEEATITALTPYGEGTKLAGENKTRQVTAGAKVKVGGSLATAQQITEANTLLNTAVEQKAGVIATQALIFAGIAESKLGGQAGSFVPNSAGYYGVLQGSSKSWPNPHDTAGMARAFLNGNSVLGFQGGGAKKLEQEGHTNPVEIAVKVEVPSIWPANAYAAEANYSEFLPEAKEIIAAYGGGVLPSASESGGGAPSKTKESEIARGTTENPDENSWDCITRLANRVNWFAFSNGHTLYYMDGPELAAQKPSLYINAPENKIRKTNGTTETGVLQVPLIYTFDNTTWEYIQDRKLRGRTQRRSRVSKPQTPSEIRMNLVCAATDYRAGEVFIFENSGPINGRWIVADATRLCIKDTYTQFILVPPTLPIPETQTGEPVTSPLKTSKAPEGKGGYSRLIGSTATYAGPDQGLDFTGRAPVYALDEGEVVRADASNTGWPGEGALYVYKITAGKHAGRFVYTAEDFKSGLKVGQKIKRGDQIGEATGSGRAPGIETGFAQNALGQAFGNPQEGKGSNPPDPEALRFKQYVETE